MSDLYEFIANSDVNNMNELNGYVDQINSNKNLLITGLYNREFYNGDFLYWAGGEVTFYSQRSKKQNIYLIIRTDVLSVDEVMSRMIKLIDQIKFKVLGQFSVRDAKYLILKSEEAINGYAQIKLKTQNEIKGEGRKISIPISRVLVVGSHLKVSLDVLKFISLTGMSLDDIDIFPYSKNSDRVADYFNDVSKELFNES